MNAVVGVLLNSVLSLLKTDDVKDIIDDFLDKLEDRVADSSNKIDDAVILPLLKKVREKLNVPDND